MKTNTTRKKNNPNFFFILSCLKKPKQTKRLFKKEKKVEEKKKKLNCDSLFGKSYLKKIREGFGSYCFWSRANCSSSWAILLLCSSIVRWLFSFDCSSFWICCFSNLKSFGDKFWLRKNECRSSW